MLYLNETLSCKSNQAINKLNFNFYIVQVKSETPLIADYRRLQPVAICFYLGIFKIIDFMIMKIIRTCFREEH
jgi:hypothetical protein